ncbi:hypothetical protein [Pseudomonas chlororaphis]|uniref:MAE-28990/MAE-18760-like HEPN domain-containing protein n=1 Tax=Pseudomonas chlororaphis TaxID=587753 RepID=A0A1Q8ETX3_9PSED|nr:hypothetical protein [Pseudomonas chlororaphis]OLF55255.1 hypothetical protein BTN82_09690 [Pseudomonas chlororaphis]
MSDKPFRLDRQSLPCDYPTHRHTSIFGEQLGRTVATCGFLEQVLGRAIFALTATCKHAEDELEEACGKWQSQLERALSDPLGGLINAYSKALRDHHLKPIINPNTLIDDLRGAAQLRNVLCHGSWQVPDADGKSLPLFVDKKLRVFNTPMDVSYLKQVRAHITDLVCSVIDSVSSVGLQFPGDVGPGDPVWE